MKVFGVIKDITLLGFLMRTFIVGIVSFLVGRYMMKRTINQLTPYDFTVVWILGAITVAPLLDGEISFKYTMVPLVTLFFWHYIITIISLNNRKIGFLFNGKPIILIDNGKIIVENLKKQFINVDLLLSELRLKSIFDPSEVKYAVLEPNGHLSIIKKEKFNSVVAKDLKISTKPIELPLVIINDGKLFEENLQALDLNKEWLFNNFKMYNINSIEEVYLATVDNFKKLYISKK